MFNYFKLILYVAIGVSGLGHVDTRPQRKKGKVLFYKGIVKNIATKVAIESLTCWSRIYGRQCILKDFFKI